MADVVAPFTVINSSGVELNQQWKNGAEAYLGTTVSGFPNWFFIVGPNTGLGHSFMVIMIEAQVDHIMRCIHAMRRANAHRIEVRREAERAYNDGLQARLNGAVWATGCSSWYRDRTGKNSTLWPSFTFTFRRLADRFEATHYRVGGQPVGVLPASRPASSAAEHAA